MWAERFIEHGVANSVESSEVLVSFQERRRSSTSRRNLHNTSTPSELSCLFSSTKATTWPRNSVTKFFKYATSSSDAGAVVCTHLLLEAPPPSVRPPSTLVPTWHVPFELCGELRRPSSANVESASDWGHGCLLLRLLQSIAQHLGLWDCCRPPTSSLPSANALLGLEQRRNLWWSSAAPGSRNFRLGLPLVLLLARNIRLLALTLTASRLGPLHHGRSRPMDHLQPPIWHFQSAPSLARHISHGLLRCKKQIKHLR